MSFCLQVFYGLDARRLRAPDTGTGSRKQYGPAGKAYIAGVIPKIRQPRDGCLCSRFPVRARLHLITLHGSGLWHRKPQSMLTRYAVPNASPDHLAPVGVPSIRRSPPCLRGRCGKIPVVDGRHSADPRSARRVFCTCSPCTSHVQECVMSSSSAASNAQGKTSLGSIRCVGFQRKTNRRSLASISAKSGGFCQCVLCQLRRLRLNGHCWPIAIYQDHSRTMIDTTFQFCRSRKWIAIPWTTDILAAPDTGATTRAGMLCLYISRSVDLAF